VFNWKKVGQMGQEKLHGFYWWLNGGWWWNERKRDRRDKRNCMIFTCDWIMV
jgi:hypothetical protein